MTPKKQKISRKSILISLLIIALLGAGTFAYSRLTNDRDVPAGTSNGVNYGPPTQEEKKAAEDQKVQTIDDQPAQPQPAASKQATISSAQQSSAGGAVVVQTQLVGRGWLACDLSVSKAGSPNVSKTADALYQPSYSTCAGFSIDSNEFATNGTWTVNLTVTNSDGTTSTADPVTVSVSR